MRFADSAQHTYCRIEAGQGERKHAFVHQCPDQASGLAVIPGALWCGGDPHHLGKAINQSLKPDTARSLVGMLDTAERKSTRLNSVTNGHLVCRLLLDKKKQ